LRGRTAQFDIIEIMIMPATLISLWRGRLHVPDYVGVALGAFAAAFIFGRVSGTHGVRGTHLGEALSIVFFLLVAVAVGAVLALFFHRDPPTD
jgi:hypothetical protein